MRTRPLLLVLVLVLASHSSLAASEHGGLSMNYSKIVVENLPVGQTISMSRLANLPLVIGNNFDKPLTVDVTVMVPTQPRDGYEAVPDALWIAPATKSVTIAANSRKKMDVTLMIPNDHYLFGRRFQADIIVRSVAGSDQGGMAFSYELTGSLLFSVAPVANEQALSLAMSKPLDAAYELDPPRVDVFEVVPGSTITVGSESGKPVVLTNGSEKPQRYALKSVDPASTQVTPDPGSHFPGTVNDVAISETDFELAPKESKPLQLSVHVPEAADLASGPLVYLVSVRNGAEQGVEQYVKIYLWSGKRPPKPELGKL